MPLLDAVLTALRPRSERINDREALATFLGRQGAFLSQKCVTEFCRVRAGVYWEKLFREAEFQSALLASTWACYTPALAMAAEMVEGVVRPAAQGHEHEVRTALIGIAKEARDGLVLPPEADKERWDQQAGLVEDRLAHATLAPPRPVRHLPDPLARQIFEALPIHQQLLTNDFDYIYNNLRMNLLRAHDDFVKAADVPAIVRSLLA